MVRFEPNVRVVYWSEQISRIVHLASVWSLVTQIGVVINSADDGRHSKTTLHGLSLALDLDTEGDRPNHLPELHRYIARHLPAGYDVLLESDHVHVEFDTHRPTPAIPPAPRPPAQRAI